MLSLVAAGLGVSVEALGWQLSAEASRSARQPALEEAVRNLRGRADAAAALLGRQFDAFDACKDVRPDVPHLWPQPRMLGEAASVQAAQPPSVAAEQIRLSATAEAEVLLKPR